MLFGWSLDNDMHTLHCFFLASRLKINLLKSKLVGVGVSFMKVEEVTMLVGRVSIHPPFIYLGLLVGESISWMNV